jgi:hypothetical protein
MVTLQPGQSTQWKVRLELFPLAMELGPRIKLPFSGTPTPPYLGDKLFVFNGLGT